MSRTEAETLEAHIVNHLNRILEHRVAGRSVSFSQRFDDSIHQSISQKDTEQRSSYHECNLAHHLVVSYHNNEEDDIKRNPCPARRKRHRHLIEPDILAAVKHMQQLHVKILYPTKIHSLYFNQILS